MVRMKDNLGWSILTLLIIQAMILGGTTGANETGVLHKMNDTNSINLSAASTNLGALSSMNITTNLSEIKGMDMSFNHSRLMNETKGLGGENGASDMRANPANNPKTEVESQTSNNSGRRCPCNSEG
jgi:hypothetical protein